MDAFGRLAPHTWTWTPARSKWRSRRDSGFDAVELRREAVAATRALIAKALH
jgi:hypothetical protein